MNHHLSLFLFLGLLLLTACDPGRYERMQQQLAALQAMNKADSVLTDDSLAQALADYFDRHGTPNEQMEAHYLLGRTHADRGEAPAAIDAYLDAIDRADTTAADCNYRQLCRVYAQMGDIFYKQDLFDSQILCLDKSVFYALRARDTLMALNSYGHKMLYYGQLNMPDSVISLSKKIYRQYKLMGYPEIGAQYYGFAIKHFLIKGENEKARECMNIYETCSGLFDENRSIVRGKEAYYNSKGYYYLSTHQYDSAQFFFRKELAEGRDYNNQNMGALALTRLFMRTGQTDSAAKYGLYAYEMNDSVYAEMKTKSVAAVNAIYNYSRHQDTAIREKERADREEKRALYLTFIVAAALFLSLLVVILWMNYKSRKEKKQSELVRALSIAQMDLVKARTIAVELKTESSELRTLIRNKEEETERLRAELVKKRRKLPNVKVEKELVNSDTFKMLQKKIDCGKPLTNHDREQLNILIINKLPEFYQFISSNKFALTRHEYEACILFRLHLRPSPISVLMGVSPSMVTKLSKTLLVKLFNDSGNKNDLMALLNQYT